MQTTFIVSLILVSAALLTLCFLPGHRLRLGKKLFLLLIAMMLSVLMLEHQLLVQVGKPITWGQSALHTFKTLGVSERVDTLIVEMTNLQQENEGMIHFLRYYCVFLYICIPLCASALVLRVLTGLSAKLRLKTHCFRPAYVFSCLHEGSLTLAESILKDAGKDRPLFIFSHGKEAPAPLQDRANKLRAVLWQGAMEQKDIPRLAYATSFFLMDEDENKNLYEMKQFLSRPDTRRFLPDKHVLRLYVFASGRQAEDIIAAEAKCHTSGRIRVILSVNASLMMAQLILSRYPLPMGRPGENMQWTDILLVGQGPLMETMLETAFYAAQLPLRTPRITVISEEAEGMRRRFYERAPMMLDPSAKAVMECGSIRFLPLKDSPAEMLDELAALPDYLFISCGNDALNRDMALCLANEIDRRRLNLPGSLQKKASVLYHVRDSVFEKICLEYATGEGGDHACLLAPVGSDQDCFSMDALFNNPLMVQGFFLNDAYDRVISPQKEKLTQKALRKDYVSYLNAAYNRRSSMASALHLSYRLEGMEAGFSVDELAVCESRRWNAYMMMEGYSMPSLQQMQAYMYRDGLRHVHTRLRLHPCLTSAVTPMQDDLWKRSGNADPLDEISLYLQDVVAEKLEQLLKEDKEAEPLLEKMKNARCKQDAMQAKAALRKHAANLPGSCAHKAQAIQLAKDLFRDMKEYDRDIVSHTREICDSAQKYQQAFRSSWIA